MLPPKHICVTNALGATMFIDRKHHTAQHFIWDGIEWIKPEQGLSRLQFVFVRWWIFCSFFSIFFSFWFSTNSYVCVRAWECVCVYVCIRLMAFIFKIHRIRNVHKHIHSPCTYAPTNSPNSLPLCVIACCLSKTSKYWMVNKCMAIWQSERMGGREEDFSKWFLKLTPWLTKKGNILNKVFTFAFGFHRNNLNRRKGPSVMLASPFGCSVHNSYLHVLTHRSVLFSKWLLDISENIYLRRREREKEREIEAETDSYRTKERVIVVDKCAINQHQFFCNWLILQEHWHECRSIYALEWVSVRARAAVSF